MHECRGLNMTLDALSVHQKTVCFNHPEKSTGHAEMAEMFKRITSEAHAHVFHHQLRADRHNADGNGFNISPAPRLACDARHPADIDNVSYRWCPGTDHVIFDVMVSVPLRASTALQSAILSFCACFFSQKHRSQAFRSFFA